MVYVVFRKLGVAVPILKEKNWAAPGGEANDFISVATTETDLQKVWRPVAADARVKGNGPGKAE